MAKKKTAQSLKRQVFFSIITPDYFAHALSLMNSVRQENPQAERYVIVLGKGLNELQKKNKLFKVIEFADWAKDDPTLFNLAFRYTAFQLCCAMKPYVAAKLIRDFKFDKVVYLDTDIRVFASFDFLFDLLDKSPVVITPHLLDPDKNLNDGKIPTEGTILSSGTFNMGFFATSSSSEGLQFLDWWRDRTFFRCEKKIVEGYFDDQKWIDLIPGLFPAVHILKHLGCNVAYWNLHERTIKKVKDKWYCGSERLIFYHYSGYTLHSPFEVSPYQTRYSLVGHPYLEEIFSEYANALLRNSVEKFHRIPYQFNYFDNKVEILPLLRNIYSRAENGDTNNFGNPFSALHDGSFFQWVNDPGTECVSPFALALRASRPDVVRQLPYPSGRRGNLKIQEWASEHGIKEMHVPKVWSSLTQIATARAEGQLKVESEMRRDGYKFYISPAIGFGVNLIGYGGSEKGMGVAYRRSADCLRQAGIPFKELRVTDLQSENLYIEKSRSWNAEYNINLIHVNPCDLEHLINSNPQFLRERINIGYWAWEFPEFPKKFRRWLSIFDEIWTPSTFVQEAVLSISDVPVVKVPHAISDEWKPMSLSGRSKQFKFLVTFDFDSFVERKNPSGAVEAFLKAFPNVKPEVKLVVKSMRGNKYPVEYERLKKKALNDSRIEWIDEVYSDAKNRELMSSCDCYVSLHRSEGFGLSLIEAIQLNKPVIATAYSGSNDFLNSETGFPVKYTLTKLKKAYFPYEAGSTWAEPDVDDAAKQFRFIFENYQLAQDRAINGGRLVRNQFSVRTVSSDYKKRLSFLRLRTPRNV